MSQMNRVALLSMFAAGMSNMGASIAVALKANDVQPIPSPMPGMGLPRSRGKGRGTPERRYGNDCNNAGRFVPHQNTRECNRRVMQMAKATAKLAQPLELAA